MTFTVDEETQLVILTVLIQVVKLAGNFLPVFLHDRRCHTTERLQVDDYGLVCAVSLGGVAHQV